MLLFVHIEPAPSTVTAPVEPEEKAILPAWTLLTVPPLVIFSVPLPGTADPGAGSRPMWSRPPLTMTVPVEPGAEPMQPTLLVTGAAGDVQRPVAEDADIKEALFVHIEPAAVDRHRARRTGGGPDVACW